MRTATSLGFLVVLAGALPSGCSGSGASTEDALEPGQAEEAEAAAEVKTPTSVEVPSPTEPRGDTVDAPRSNPEDVAPTLEPGPFGPAPEPEPEEAVTASPVRPEAPSAGTGGATNAAMVGAGGTAGSTAGATAGVDSETAGSGETAEPEVMPEPISFADVQQEVFEPAGCTAGYCHGGSAGDLTWSYEALVSAAAAEPVCGLTDRVVPFDPEGSVLWARVQPADPAAPEPCAEPMPQGGPPLTPEQAQLVYDWIAGGAAP